MSIPSARVGLRLGLMAAALAAVLLAVKFRKTTPASASAPVAEVAAKSGPGAGPSIATDPQACGPADLPTGNTFAAAVTAKARREEALAKIAVFDDWLTQWRRADASAQPALAGTGREIALARRDALKHLIQTDPQRALELAVAPGLRAELPASIQEQLEERLDGRGELDVMITHVGAEARYDREVLLEGKRYQAYVYGRREQQATKIGLPLHGIAIDQVFALAAEPYRLLDDAEKASRGIALDRVAVAVGKEFRVLADGGEIASLEKQLVEAESAPGPRVIEKQSGVVDPSSGTPPTAAVTSPASWIEGAKRVLWVQVDFADDQGAVATPAEIAATSATVSDFYAANSQGKTTLTFTVLPQVLRLPRDKAYYNLSSSTVSELQDNANTLAKQYDAANGNAGTYDPDRYDRWIVLFKRVPVYAFGGQALLGGARVRMNANILPGTAGHELGHTQSLDHSHYWLPGGSSAVGAGTHVEYGDVFDIMGSSGSGPNNHFNAAQKAKLGYLDAASITTVTEAGVYRINRHDHADASGLRALKIAPPDLGYEYWVEHRRFGPTAFNASQLDRLRNGVLLHWGPTKAPKFTSGAGSYLVDATPGSAGGATDSALRVGETFTDPDAGVTIKPIAVGGTAPTEYIDVQVAFGAIDGNHNPTLQAEAPAGALIARSNVIFNASGSDPDGDSVYFRWDFGDNTVQPNLSNITRRFLKGGTYSLRVSAHDGKGGIAAKILPLTVADPLTSWTSRTSGVTTTLNGVTYAGGSFVAGGAGFMLTSPDGVTWTRCEAGTSTYTWLAVAHNGARYVAVGTRTGSTDRGGAIYSDDGVTWTLATVPAGTGQIQNVAYGAGRFVAVGETGRIYTSTDGATWTNATSPVTNILRSVVYADGLFVATGDSGRILTSSDGVTWNNRSVPTGNTLGAVARHNNVWYTISATLESYVSTDGVAWKRIATAGRTNNANRLISASGVLFSTTANGSIAFAEEPQTWVTHQLDATPSTTLTAAAEGNGVLVVVGSRGLVFTTTSSLPASPLIAAPTLRNEADSLKVSVGRKNVLSASGTDFVRLELYANGTKVSELTGTAGALSWTPTAVGTYSLVVRGIKASGESVVSAAVPAQAGLASWNWRNPTPVGADLFGAVRVGETWWVVGGVGTLLKVDASGIVTRVEFPTTQRLTGIGYANGRFVVSAPYVDGASREEIGALWTSTDGYAWTPLLTENTNNFNLNFVTYLGDRWVAGSTGGTLLTSIDGLDWARQNSGVTNGLRSAAYGDGRWVVVGTSGRILSSTDGVAWTSRTSGVTTDLSGVTYGSGAFVVSGASGVILTSQDGTNWTRQNSGVTGVLNGASFVKGAWVVVGDTAGVLTSTNLTNWTPASLEGNTITSIGVVGQNDEGIILGRGGQIFRANTATSWRRLTSGTSEARNAVLYAGGKFVAVGGTIDPISNTASMPVVISTDGSNWSRAVGNTSFTQNTVTLNAITYGQQTYVVSSGAGRIFTSTDANIWTQRTAPVTTALTALAAGPSGFVAAGANGVILSSPDGVSWVPRTSGVTSQIRGGAFGNGRFVLVGDGGTVVTSTDGTTWTAATSGVTASLLAIGWWDNVGFIAAGNSGTMISSIDGVTWKQVETGVADNLAVVAKTPIGFVAAGGTAGTMLVSFDGENWSISTIPVDRVVRGIAASASTIVAVGDTGATLSFDLVDRTPVPVITAQPASIAMAIGSSATFSVSAQNAFGAVYQWMKDGVPIAGANTPTYSITNAAASRAGNYTVSITSPTGVATSAAATLSFAAVTDPGRLVNLSILTALTSRDDTFTFGFVVGGANTSGAKALLVRAAGPSLNAVGVTGALDDPKLEFYTGTTKVGENDNWGGGEQARTAMAEVGAFPFTSSTSRDAAIFLPSLAPGANSARISGTGSGAVIAELYDATPSTAFTNATPRLVNVSVLKHIGDGVTAGFVIGGSTARTVLVRAIGPTLGGAPFGVAGVVADPRLALFRGQTQIAANDNWGGSAALAAAFTGVGAFALPPASLDAALLIELQPGNYTVQVGGANGGTGVALVEVYEVP